MLEFNSLSYDCLLIFLFLINFYFTRWLPRSSTLRLLKQQMSLYNKTLRVFRGTCLQFMIDCICVHSKAFYVVLHFCVYCVYWWWTSSTRWSPYKARSRSELKLNLMIVAMSALSNHLFWHSFNCSVLFCSVCSLWYHLCWSSVPGDMMTLKHGIHRGIYGL